MVGHGVNELINRECIFRMTDKKEITKYWRQRRLAHLLKSGIIVLDEDKKEIEK